MVNDFLRRSIICLFNTNEDGKQYKHTCIYFEVELQEIEDLVWPYEGIEAFDEIGYLVSAMCLIRSEMSLEKTSLAVLTTDTRGGVGASAVFLSMYEMMQEVDEGFTTDNKLKQNATGVNIFAIANRLRKDRERNKNSF